MEPFPPCTKSGCRAVENPSLTGLWWTHRQLTVSTCDGVISICIRCYSIGLLATQGYHSALIHDNGIIRGAWLISASVVHLFCFVSYVWLSDLCNLQRQVGCLIYMISLGWIQSHNFARSECLAAGLQVGIHAGISVLECRGGCHTLRCVRPVLRGTRCEHLFGPAFVAHRLDTKQYEQRQRWRGIASGHVIRAALPHDSCLEGSGQSSYCRTTSILRLWQR